MELFEQLVTTFPAEAFGAYFSQISAILTNGLLDQADGDVSKLLHDCVPVTCFWLCIVVNLYFLLYISDLTDTFGSNKCNTTLDISLLYISRKV